MSAQSSERTLDYEAIVRVETIIKQSTFLGSASGQVQTSLEMLAYLRTNVIRLLKTEAEAEREEVQE